MFNRNDPVLKEQRRGLRRNQTDAEKAFWSKVRAKQFYGIKFFRQYSIGPYILDFYCPTLKLAVELDGGQHTEKQNQEYDTARTEYLTTQGIKVVRFWNNEVLCNIDGVLEKITPPAPPLNLRGGNSSSS
ncbi:MAG: endonuclease domain-containing protein [Nitrospirae bacterium]|nr:MAG: endonuclease domain-containing protein [Nitrospirota bacterium]